MREAMRYRAGEALGEPPAMRARIKSLALDLLIQHGYRGVTFGDLADALGTTRANIHYHFGNKQALVEEVLVDYVESTLAALQEVWATPGLPFARRIETMVDYSRQRYAKYNPPGTQGRPWSLIARMRQDSEALTPAGRAALQRFGKELYACIVRAIEDAKARHEFVAWMPVEDVALQLVSIANSAGPITQDAGDFDRLEQLYAAFTRIMTHAFGKEAAARDGVATRR
jgi:TetR/AcrR family transcriptional regulator, transcriptional repressor for nem operon